jgi:hypothetical protein
LHKLTFFPLGNADCCRIDLENGRKLLVDYAATRDLSAADDRRADLPTLLREDLDEAAVNAYDVVVFTHLDEDHYKGATDFFYLEHARKYQDEHRIRIKELWIPAGLLLEELGAGATQEARVLRAEARHRFQTKKGIRVFGRPKLLEKYCEENAVSLDEREHLITDAGQTVPGFAPANDGLEIFVHSPFAYRIDEGLEDRNRCSFVCQARFSISGRLTDFLLLNDADFEALRDIVRTTRRHSKEDRLAWHVLKVPHHCSYRSIDSERGETKTAPQDWEIDWLYEDQQNRPGILISSSWNVPPPGTVEDDDQPPHRQAAAYYRDVLNTTEDFYVTMDHPRGAKRPRPIVITIGDQGPTVLKETVSASASIVSSRGERYGSHDHLS